MAQHAKKVQRFDLDVLVANTGWRLMQEHPAAFEALVRLTEAGAADWWVCYLLHMMEFERDDSRSKKRNATPRSIKRTGERLKSAVRVIDRAREDPQYEQVFPEAGELVEQLKQFAEAHSTRATQFDRKRPRVLHALMNALLHHVEHVTGRAHHQEIDELLQAMGFDNADSSQWKKRHGNTRSIPVVGDREGSAQLRGVRQQIGATTADDPGAAGRPWARQQYRAQK